MENPCWLSFSHCRVAIEHHKFEEIVREMAHLIRHLYFTTSKLFFPPTIKHFLGSLLVRFLITISHMTHLSPQCRCHGLRLVPSTYFRYEDLLFLHLATHFLQDGRAESSQVGCLVLDSAARSFHSLSCCCYH